MSQQTSMSIDTAATWQLPEYQTWFKFQGLRWTEQREELCRWLSQQDGPFTIEQIVDQFSRRHSAHRATIYREINLLTERKVLKQLGAQAGGPQFFEKSPGAAAHFYCTCCRSLHTLPVSPDLAEQLSCACPPKIGQTQVVGINLSGKCHNCHCKGLA